MNLANDSFLSFFYLLKVRNFYKAMIEHLKVLN